MYNIHIKKYTHTHIICKYNKYITYNKYEINIGIFPFMLRDQRNLKKSTIRNLYSALLSIKYLCSFKILIFYKYICNLPRTSKK